MSLRIPQRNRSRAALVRAVVEAMESRMLLSGSGLTGQYFNTQTLTGYKFNETDPQINFSWGATSPGDGISSNNFSGRWEGTLDPTTTGTYTFYINGDGGEQLFVNGDEIINNWTSHTTQDTSATITLNAGTMYSIEQDYFSNTSSAATSLSWSMNGGATTLVPEANLYPLSSGPGTYTPTSPNTTPGTPSTTGMPAGWSFEDIDSPTPAGSSTYDSSTSVFTVNGGGTLFGGVNDQFQYADTEVTGDFTFVTQLTSMTDANNGSMAGAMVRTGLIASTPELFVGEQPSTIVWGTRRVLAGSAENSNNNYSTAVVDPYLKLVRGGNTIDSYYSADDVNWTFMYGQQFNSLPDTIYVGLAVASRTSSSVCTATFANTSITSPGNNNSTAWVGNTFGGGNAHVPDDANAAYVDPATGQVILNSTDEGYALDIFNTDGSFSAFGNSSHFLQGTAVYADSNFIFTAQDNGSFGTASGDVSGFERYDRYGNSIGSAIMGNDTITGITESGGYLYIAANNMVYQFSPSTLDFTGTMWEVDRAGNMATDSSGNLWIIQNAGGGNAAQVTEYTSAGVATGTAITFPTASYSGNTVVPSGIAVDPANGEIYVTDIGALQNIHYYNTSGSYLGDFGYAYGIYGTGGSTVAGADAPLKFDFPVGVGFDDSGNIYVVDGYPLNNAPTYIRLGTSIRKFTSGGSELWADNNYEYVGVAAADPSTPTNLYTEYWQLAAKYNNAQPGDDASAVSTLIDPFAYPTDPRLVPSTIATYPKLSAEFYRTSPIIRTIDGSKFLFDFDQQGTAVNVYRFVSETDYTAFCGELEFGDGASPNQFYIWIDANGDAVKQTSEESFSTADYVGQSFGQYVDSNGNIWLADKDHDKVWEFAVGSALNSIGAPVYSFANAQSWAVPTTGTYALPITALEKAYYIASSNTMILGAYTTSNPNPSGAPWGQAGSTFYAFTNWSTDGFNQSPEWTTVIPNNLSTDPIKSIDIAGSYIFANSDQGPTGIEVFSLSTGALVTTLTPTAYVNSNNSGIDFLNSINATYNSSTGQYEIFNENDAEGNSTLYQWTPANGTTPTVTSPAAGWTNEDLDNHPHGEVEGSTSYNVTNQTWTVNGAGDIWPGLTYDYSQFASTALTGDGEIVAELTSQTYPNTSGARAGVMLRDTSGSQSQFAGMLFLQSNTVDFMYRTTADTASTAVAVSGLSLPIWLKVVRSGNSFSGYYSTNGSSWTQVGTTQTIAMAASIQAGLAVSSHDSSEVSTATFTNLIISPTLTPTDIGSPTLAGSATWDGYAQTYTVNGGGAGVGGSSDQFQFTSEATNDSGTGLILTRLDSISATTAQAGIMYRNSSAANDPYVALLQTSAGLNFQWRSTAGGSTTTTTLAGVTGPIWIELTRSGNSFSAYFSPDGINWTQIGSVETVTMATNALAGLAVSSLNNSAPLATAVFNKLEVE
jgi:hypothetical protein